MGEIDDSRTQREAMDAVKARKATGVERRLGALHSYLTALLYDEKREARPDDKTDDKTDDKDRKEEPA
jgi:hypothetical protein